MMMGALLTDRVDLRTSTTVLATDIPAHVTTGVTKLEVVSGGQLYTMGEMQAMIDGSVSVDLLDASNGIWWHGVALEWTPGAKPAPVRAHGQVIYWRCSLTKVGASWKP